MTPQDGAATPRTRREKMSHLIMRAIAVLVLLAVLVGFYIYFNASETAPQAQSTTQQQPPPVVSTLVLQTQVVPLSPQYIGQVVASQVVEVLARVDGFLEERAFEEGSIVEQGRLLYRIDPRSYQAELAIAESRHSEAVSRLELARQQYERYQQLSAQGASTSKELDESRTAFQVAEAQVQLAEAQIAQAQLDLSYTVIQSPIRGHIGESMQEEGAYVGSGGDTLLAVVRQLDPIYVRLSISEEEALRFEAMVASGQIQAPDLDAYEVLITLSTGQEYPLHGRINFIDVQVDPNTGTLMIRATVPNPDGILVPGQFVHATVLGASRTETILVPQQAVSQTPTGSSVYVVGSDGIAERRPVTLGRWYEDQWIVEEGLSQGDRIITDQLMQLRPGMAVHIGSTATSLPAATSQPRSGDGNQP